MNGKRQFLPTAKFFQKSLDEAILGVTTGAFSYDVALKKVIQDMTRSGLRTVEYASGRTYRVDSASRTALMTGFRQVIGHINEQLADDWTLTLMKCLITSGQDRRISHGRDAYIRIRNYSQSVDWDP